MDPASGNKVTKMAALFDTGLSAHDSNGKPSNFGSATGVTIDLVPFAQSGNAKGLDLTQTTPLDQYGSNSQAGIQGGTYFTAKYYKTTTDPAGAGDVAVKLTVTNQYQ